MSQVHEGRRPVRRNLTTRALALLVVPVLLMTGCKVSDVTDPIVKPIESLFGLGKGEVSTPKFKIVNGITIQVVVRVDDVRNGVPVTVRIRCAGGTEASSTVTLRQSGSISIGQTTFTPTWPAGTDCLVSQEIVQGVEVVEAALDWVGTKDVKATFENA